MSDLANKITGQIPVKEPQWLKEFKAFIMRGNVIDLAVGVVIGAAFTSIVTSMVEDIFNPIIGLLVSPKTDADLLSTSNQHKNKK